MKCCLKVYTSAGSVHTLQSFCGVRWWLFLRPSVFTERRRCCKKWFVIQQIARTIRLFPTCNAFSCCKVTVRFFFATKCFSHYSCAFIDDALWQVSQSIIDELVTQFRFSFGATKVFPIRKLSQRIFLQVFFFSQRESLSKDFQLFNDYKAERRKKSFAEKKRFSSDLAQFNKLSLSGRRSLHKESGAFRALCENR